MVRKSDPDRRSKNVTVVEFVRRHATRARSHCGRKSKTAP